MGSGSAVARRRILASRCFAALFLALVVTTGSAHNGNLNGLVLGLAGWFLIGIAVAGRLWWSLYISGYKDADLVTTGPYSLCRHPLYLFSLLGFGGIGLATRSLTLTALIVGAFLLTYPAVLRREEAFLLSKFGPDFETYAAHA